MCILAIKFKHMIIMVSILILTIFISCLSFAGTGKSEEKEVPIIMYHHILKDESRQGQYVVSPKTFENDLLFLKNNGYTTVTVKELVDFVFGRCDLPQKPVVITFDDGHLSTLGYIFPIIEKYNEKIVVSIVGEYTDTATNTNDVNLAYSYLKWDDIKLLSDSGLVEIANHTYNFHQQKNRVGIGSVNGESKDEYVNVIKPDLIKLNQKIKEVTKKDVLTFTYPFGKAVNKSFDLIKDIGFYASLSCEEGINIIRKNDFDCLYMLKRYNRPANISTKEFFSFLKDFQ